MSGYEKGCFYNSWGFVSKDKVYSVLISIAMGLGGFCLRWVWTTNTELKLLQDRVNQLQTDHRTDETQDRQIKWLWRYGGWFEENIFELRDKAGLHPSIRPKWD